MVDAQQVQQRGVKVVHVDAVLDDVVSVVVRAAYNGAPLGSAAGHPKRKAAAVVVAPKVVLPQRSLTVVGAAKFTAPDDKCVVEHAAILEILHQRGGGLIGLTALVAQAAR